MKVLITGGAGYIGSTVATACIEAGIDVVVKLASTEFGVVDVHAVGCSGDEAVPIAATACGEAAHPDREVAVRKALHEFAEARSRKAFMHGPLDRVRAATPPGYIDAWLDGHPPERLVDTLLAGCATPAELVERLGA